MGGRLLFAAIPPAARLAVITATAGKFAAPLTTVTALAPAAGPAVAAWLGSYTGMAFAMAAAAGTAAIMAVVVWGRSRNDPAQGD